MLAEKRQPNPLREAPGVALRIEEEVRRPANGQALAGRLQPAFVGKGHAAAAHLLDPGANRHQVAIVRRSMLVGLNRCYRK